MPDEETQPKKKKKVPTWVWIVAGVFVLVVAVASGGGGDSSNDASDEGVAVVEEGDSTTQDAAEPEEVMEAEPEAEEPAAREETGYSDGTYFVGDEIEAAIYRSTGGGSCYWERLSGFGGSFDEIIANGSGPQSIAGISSTDIGFSSSGCGSWVPVESTFPDAALTSFGDGHNGDHNVASVQQGGGSCSNRCSGDQDIIEEHHPLTPPPAGNANITAASL